MKPWENKKILIGLNIFNFLLLIVVVIEFFHDDDWKQAMIWGTMMILSIGLNFMDLEKIKKKR